MTGSTDASLREEGRHLLRRVLAEYVDDETQGTMASADLGKSLAADGHLEEAAQAFRQSLAGAPNIYWGADLGLVETILEADWRPHYDEAAQILGQSQAMTDPFPGNRFRWQLASARLAHRQGRADEARAAAVAALEALDEKRSPFPRHRSLGLASSDTQTVRELKRLAQSGR